MNMDAHSGSDSRHGDEVFSLLREVRDGLTTKQSLGYDNSVRAFKICSQHLEHEIVRRFLLDCFFQMVNILTDQIPTKIGMYEKNCVEESLNMSSQILSKLIKSNPSGFLPIFVRLFDKSVPYYAGAKTYWTSYPGNPQMRLICLKVFSDNGGFQVICNILKDPATQWLGSETLFVMVRAVLDVDRETTSKLAIEIIEAVMKAMLNITEEQLKRESTDTISSLIRAILLRRDKDHQSIYYSFWLDHTLKMINSQSIVLKLFAWDQIHDIIREAIATRPIPKRYAVLNAGNPIVNGIYECHSYPEGESPRYTKEFQVADGSKHLLTLFRCAMRSKQKWWFISEADIKCPGTDKDIDYYQHKSNIDQEREPPCCGWNTVVGNAGGSPGIDPPPVLERLGPYFHSESIPEDQVLINRLQTWVFQNHILEGIYGHSMHRELVLRSNKLLILLAEMKSLKFEHVQMIWKASLQSHEAEVVDEIHTLLISLSQYLSEDLFNHFIQLVQDTLDQSSEDFHYSSSSTVAGPSTTTSNNYLNIQKVIQFISKIDLEGQKYFRNLTSKSSLALAVLIWNTFKHPIIETIKSPMVGNIETLLMMCLNELHDAQGLNPFFMKCIQESLAAIETAAMAHSPTAASVSNSSSQLQQQQQQQNVTRVVYALHFLMSSTYVDAMLIEGLESEGRFIPVMMNEITRFVSFHHKTSSKSLSSKQTSSSSSSSSSSNVLSTLGNSQAATPSSTLMDVESAYKSHLYNRIDILRCYYGHSSQVKMPLKVLDELSSLSISHPVEREQFFIFLKMAGLKQQTNRVDAAYDLATCVYIFYNIICNAKIDWNTCGEPEFSCFSTYFSGLQHSITGFPSSILGNTQLTPMEIGLETLWRITLSTPSIQVAKNAILVLLKAYDDLVKESPEQNIQIQLLDKIFTKLEAVVTKIRAIQASPNHIDTPSLAHSAEISEISRCIEILQTSISRFRGHTIRCHAVRGCLSRMKLTIRYPKNLNLYYTSQYDLRQDKYNHNSITIDIHPLHTLLFLKQRIAESIEFYSINKLSVEKNNKILLGDTNTLSSFDITDGTELFVSMNSIAPNIYDDIDDLITTTPHFGSLIASQKRYFECLLNLIEHFEAVQQYELSRMIWELISLIPTQFDMLTQVQLALDKSDGQSTWEAIFNVKSLCRATYYLQILDAILQPAPEIYAETSEGHSQSLDVLKQQFIQGGGFVAVLDFFVSVPATRSQLSRISSAVCLHMLHYCLFDQKTSSSPSFILDTSNNNNNLGNSIGSGEINTATSLLPLIQNKSTAVVEKLLQVADYAAAADESDVVSDALMTISELMKSPGVASQLTNNPQAKSLLSIVLKSESKKVRHTAADFAIQVGQSQPIVFDWLVSELQLLEPDVTVCDDIFRALTTLIQLDQLNPVATLELDDLAKAISMKLYGSTNSTGSQQATVSHTDSLCPQMLLGCLQMLSILIAASVSLVQNADFRAHLVTSLLSDFLLAMPTAERDKRPICDTHETRQAAFSTLISLVKTSPSALQEVILQIKELSSFAANHIMNNTWGYTVSFDVKKPNIEFVGLKNQGCTCYLNSLIQQLFMCKSFRDAVLSTPLKESHRLTLWHHPNESLVGKELLFEWHNNAWRKARVVSYHADSNEHTIHYESVDGKGTAESHIFVLAEGRFQKETGRVRLPPDVTDIQNPLIEREESAERVLEQLQRTFCFMKSSKRRYFDPKPFVEACRSLNLNYNVYHQNDASEFCDNLLDRLETAMKGKHTGKDIWKHVVQKSIFGGKMLYQKIPTECNIYETEKRDCGHWKSSRRETFLKVELIIRGKEKIEDSLDELVKGELMDGDNKIMCDVCNEKKATVRRTCFGVLSNLLILHLKRFDLDFQTFETVKLNNRIAFPTSLNMFKYTKEGMEQEEKNILQQQQNNSNLNENDEDDDDEEDDSSSASPSKLHNQNNQVPDLQYETETANNLNNMKDFDPQDYEYDLQGVLVHAGIAQGGHYYSFIRDKDFPEKWYRFDDEEVSPFLPEQIPYQCYGGTVTTTIQGVSSMIEEDRSANALMLFYDKVRPIVAHDEEEEATASSSTTPIEPTPKPDSKGKTESTSSAVTSSKLIDGYQAFEQEVWESNRKHIVTTYLLDSELHNFIRSMITVITTLTDTNATDMMDPLLNSSLISPSSYTISPEWANEKVLHESISRVVHFGCHFLLDILLHCRERSNIRSWLNTLKFAFLKFTSTAESIIRHLLSPTCGWLKEFLLCSSDPLARASFVQLLTQAVISIAPKDPNALVVLLDQDLDSLNTNCMSDSPPPDYLNSLLMLLIHSILDLISETPFYTRTADELFMLVRELASIPAVNTVLLAADIVGRLAYFAMRDTVPESIRKYFNQSHTLRQNTVDHTLLLPSIYEALAALLGVPQTRKVNLLEDQINFSEPELTHDAKTALTTIFHEVARTGSMDIRDITSYWDRIFGNTQKMSTMQAKAILDRYDTNTEGRLTLEGFLRRYADVAMYNPKAVWQDLHFFGYQNDLKRIKDPVQLPGSSLPGAGVSMHGSSSPTESPLSLPEGSSQCLMELSLYEAGLDAAENATIAIVKRVCIGDKVTSNLLIRQALKELFRTVKEWVWSPTVDMIIGFIRVIVSINDEFLKNRLEQLMVGEFGLLKVIAAESRNPTSTARGHYDEYDSTRSISSRYLDFIQDLRSGNEVISAWLTDQATNNPDYRWLKQQLQPPQETVKTAEIDDENSLSRTVVIVEGAGTLECNGVYSFKKIADGAGLFQRTAIYDNKQQVFNVFRCKMNDNSRRWYISISPEYRDPGSSADKDFYFASPTTDRIRSIEDRLPPRDVWTRCQGDFSLDPCPTVTWRNGSLSPADSEDRDDTLAVGEDFMIDDSFSSMPGTPVGDGEGFVETSDRIPFASI